jgi:hypothetical protein
MSKITYTDKGVELRKMISLELIKDDVDFYGKGK